MFEESRALIDTYVRSHPDDRMQGCLLVVVERFWAGGEVGIVEEGAAFATGALYRLVIRCGAGTFRCAVSERIFIC